MLLIFDWDGTLIDSVGRIVSCLREASEEQGLPVLDYARFADVIGLGLGDAIVRLYPHLDEPSVDRYRAAYGEAFRRRDATPSALFEGVRSTLERLHRDGHRLAVATGKSRPGLDRALDALDLRGLFHATRCADETRSKPHPLMVQELLEELRRPPQDTWLIGDTEYDMAMAVAAKVTPVAVSHGVHEVARLRRYNPRHVINKIPELIDLIS
jgi:phosphoglycolate phosphatase